MRQATNNILYTTVNSRAYDPEKLQTGMLGWQKAAVAIDVVLAIILIALAAVAFKKYKKRIAEI
jgi:beta-glucosidase